MNTSEPGSVADYLRRMHERTGRVIALIPVDRFDWSPAEGAFSFADLLRHTAAIERYTFAENALGLPSRYPGHGPELARTREEVLDFCDRCNAETLDLLGPLSSERLLGLCKTPGGASLSTWKWLRSMFEHHAHHRGQIYLMLRMLGVATPPMYGLTSEQVRERSHPPGAASSGARLPLA